MALFGELQAPGYCAAFKQQSQIARWGPESKETDPSAVRTESGFLLLQVLWVWEVGGVGSGPWMMPSTVRTGFPHLNLSGNMGIVRPSGVSPQWFCPIKLVVEVNPSIRALRFLRHAWYSLRVSLACCH